MKMSWRAIEQNDLSLHLLDNLLRSRAVTALTPQILGAVDTFSLVSSRLWRTHLGHSHVNTTCQEDQIYRILSRSYLALIHPPIMAVCYDKRRTRELSLGGVWVPHVTAPESANKVISPVSRCVAVGRGLAYGAALTAFGSSCNAKVLFYGARLNNGWSAKSNRIGLGI